MTFSLISDPNAQNTAAHLLDTDLVLDRDGFYIITVNSSAVDSQTNRIQSTLQAKQLLIRNNLGDWNAEKPGSLTVDLVDDNSSHDGLSGAEIILIAAWDLQKSIVDYGVGALGLKTFINNINTLSAPSQSSTLGTLTTYASSFGHFSLTDNEALVTTHHTG